MKIGIIGCGYWGKIILNTLTQLGYTNIVLCDTNHINIEGFGFEILEDYKEIADNIWLYKGDEE
jgi:pyrroline-5-carboxylate reductase